MKMGILSTAFLVGITTMLGMVADVKAVSLNPEGRGQVLLYPYYTIRGGNDALISVVNTTDQAKSVKVRFREGVNSREVLSFNLYLAAFDTWVAALTSAESGDSVELRIPDSSCTVPYYFGDAVLDQGDLEFDRFGRVEFSDVFFTGEFDDPGTDDLERVQSGYIELIEMGTLVDDAEGSAAAATHAPQSFDDINDLPRPTDCSQLVEAWDNGYWSDDASVDHEAPSGGLLGAATIINIFEGTMFTYRAEAIDGFSTEIIHFGPTDILPDLASGNVTTSNVMIDGAMNTQTWPSSVEAVSAAILYNSIANEYIIDPQLSARSEWVITLPTKLFYIDPLATNDEVPVEPFSRVFDGATNCEMFDLGIWDRESVTVPSSLLISIPLVTGQMQPPSPYRLCYGANIVRFAEEEIITTPPIATEIMGETRFTTIPLESANFFANFAANFNQGRAEFDFSMIDDDTLRLTRSAIDEFGMETGVTYTGLPAIGFWVNTFTNGTLDFDFLDGPVLSNYGGAQRHSGNRAIVSDSGEP